MHKAIPFIKESETKKEVRGIVEKYEVYSHGEKRYEVHVDETDRLICLTTKPEEYFNEKLTIPIGKRDEEGRPIYKVVELKREFVFRR